MLIATHYLLLKIWDIFATRCCILLIFNPNYFRGGEVNVFILSIRNSAKLSAWHYFFAQFAQVRFFVTLHKLLTLGKLQIKLHFHSLNRNFASK